MAIICKDNNLDNRLEKLENDRYEKELELSKINEEIAIKEEIIDSITAKGTEVYLKVLNTLSEQEGKVFADKVEEFDESLDKAFIAREDMTPYFAKELFSDKKNEDEIKRIESSPICIWISK
jgi:hypothetical protein